MNLNFFKDYILKGHSRSVKAKKNIISSFLIKGFSIVVGFLFIRIAYHYIDETRLGIWFTISSLLTWFSFFEIGLGKGLRNKLAEALALNDKKLAKTYISTTYAVLSLIIAGVAILFFSLSSFFNWAKILNTPESMGKELFVLSCIVFGSFFLRFILQLLTNVLFADQRPALANAFGPVSNFLSLVIIYILTKTTEGSLIYLGLAMSISPVFVFVVASLFLYLDEYKDIRPSFKAVNFKYARSLVNLGVKFFILSIGHIIKYQTANIIIAQYFGPAEVTPYNIAYKYFNILAMIFTIILSPFWSAFTEAWIKKDHIWITNAIKKVLRIWMGLSILGLIMLAGAKWFYAFWVSEEVDISFRLSAIMAVYFILYTFGGIFVQFVNGVSKIKLQLYSSVIGAIIFFPMAHLFIRVFHLGVEGLVLATLITNWYGPILSPIQYRKIITNKAKGIWNK
jgi:O-antigen/teichoic acid export membrane protein